MDGGLDGFFRQIPTGLILMFCGSGALFLFAVGYMIWSRRRRRRQNENEASDPVVVQTVGPITKEVEERDMNDDDLPDLDALAHPGVGSMPESMPLSMPPVSEPVKTVKYTSEPIPSIDPDATVVPAPPRPTAAYQVTLSDGTTADAVEVLTVLRDVADGSLIIQIGNRAFRHPAIDADADFRRRLNTALRDLGTSVPSSSAASSSAASSSAASPSASSTSSAPAPGTAAASPGDLPKFRLEDLPPATARRGRKPATVEIPEINVGGSIEAFLQHKRVTNGDFPGRHIHVRGGLGGAIVIEVDGNFYDAISDVEDDDVRTYLQETIAEWQSRQ